MLARGNKMTETNIKFLITLLEAKHTDVKIIGEGGFSMVFSGISKNVPGRQEAIKAKKEERSKKLGKIEHKNVIKVYTAKWNAKAQDGEKYVLIYMEFCENTLWNIIKGCRNKGISQKYARKYVSEILTGTAKLHSKNILHRDLKPGNIMIKEGRIKIGDFNISKILGVGPTTKPQDIAMTVAYSPPERINRMKADMKLDSWSIGCIYYEMIEGRKPFTGHYDQLVQNISSISYPPLKNGDEFDLIFLSLTLAKPQNRCTVLELINQFPFPDSPLPKLPPQQNDLPPPGTSKNCVLEEGEIDTVHREGEEVKEEVKEDINGQMLVMEGQGEHSTELMDCSSGGTKQLLKKEYTDSSQFTDTFRHIRSNAFMYSTPSLLQRLPQVLQPTNDHPYKVQEIIANLAEEFTSLFK